MHIHLKNALLVIVILAGSGCATIDIGTAKKVAKSGIELSGSTETSINLISTYVESALASQYVLSGLTPRTPPDAAPFSKVGDLLAARKLAFQGLIKTYTAFDALASYGSVGEIEGAIDGFTSSLNAYRALLPSPGEVISSKSAGYVRILGGQITKTRQSKLLIQESKNIAALLERLVGLIRQEKAIYNSLAEVSLATQALAAIEFWKLGIGAPHKIVEDSFSGLGLTNERDQFQASYQAMSASERGALEKAIASVVTLNANRQVGATKATFENVELGLLQLISAHKKMENLQDVSLDQVQARIINMRMVIETLTAARNS